MTWMKYQKNIGQVEPTPEPAPQNPEQPGDDERCQEYHKSDLIIYHFPRILASEYSKDYFSK